MGRPTLERESKEVPSATTGGGDMVQALIEAEARKKQERELKRKEEEAAAQKKADLQSKSADQLRKLLTAKGQTAAGKKDEMIEELLRVGIQEEAAAKRK